MAVRRVRTVEQAKRDTSLLPLRCARLWTGLGPLCLLLLGEILKNLLLCKTDKFLLKNEGVNNVEFNYYMGETNLLTFQFVLLKTSDTNVETILKAVLTAQLTH